MLTSLRRPLLVAARSSRLNSTITPNPHAVILDDLASSQTHSLPPRPPPNGYPKSVNPISAHRARATRPAEENPRPRFRLYVHSTRNNTITTFTQPNGYPIAWFSGGSCGFKKGNRASYEAGHQCAVRMFRRVEEHKSKEGIKHMELDIYFKGFGQGRDALHRALLTSEGESIRPLVATVTDRTAIKIGGTRAPKTRRL